MKFSIVTVVRNDAALIAETMSSVLDGNADCEVEYIVIDGASTDGTVEVVAKRSGELACFVSEPDSGIYDAMNKGIFRATGDVVGIINSGDRYMPGALKLVEHALDGKCDERHILWGDVEYERGGRVREERVGLHLDSVGALDRKRVAERGGGHLDPAAAEDVDDGHRLDVLKALRQHHERACHVRLLSVVSRRSWPRCT